ncbi:hypothetical protein AB1L30_14785 [Bremerella sp. JC817]|uniref:hypothetical protein n=1 Tax=Bremerella sp. JC817 TaxID=3231756 RepID=UPI0034585034
MNRATPPIAKYQTSLKALLLITTVLATVCAWYRHDPFERSVEAVLSHGGGVSYSDQTIYVSFGPCMPSGAAESWINRNPGDVAVGDLHEIHDELKILATSCKTFKIEFSDVAQANGVKQYLDCTLTQERTVNLVERQPGWQILVVRKDEP